MFQDNAHTSLIGLNLGSETDLAQAKVDPLIIETKKGFSNLAPIMTSTHPLTHLVVKSDHACFEDQDLTYLVKVLTSLPYTLEQLKLELGSNTVSDEGMETFISLLSSHRCPKEISLILPGAKVSGKGLVQLLEVLGAKHQDLISFALELSEHKAQDGDLGGRKLVELLKSAHYPQEFSLDFSYSEYFSEAVMAELFEALSTHSPEKKLQLNIAGATLGDQSRRALLAFLASQQGPLDLVLGLEKVLFTKEDEDLEYFYRFTDTLKGYLYPGTLQLLLGFDLRENSIYPPERIMAYSEQHEALDYDAIYDHGPIAYLTEHKEENRFSFERDLNTSLMKYRLLEAQRHNLSLFIKDACFQPESLQTHGANSRDRLFLCYNVRNQLLAEHPQQQDLILNWFELIPYHYCPYYFGLLYQDRGANAHLYEAHIKLLQRALAPATIATHPLETIEVGLSDYWIDEHMLARLLQVLALQPEMPKQLLIKFEPDRISTQGIEKLLQQITRLQYREELRLECWALGLNWTELAPAFVSLFTSEACPRHLNVNLTLAEMRSQALVSLIAALEHASGLQKFTLQFPQGAYTFESIACLIRVLESGRGPKELHLIFYHADKFAADRPLLELLLHTLRAQYYPGKLTLSFNFNRFSTEEAQAIKSLLTQVLYVNPTIFLFAECLKFNTPHDTLLAILNERNKLLMDCPDPRYLQLILASYAMKLEAAMKPSEAGAELNLSAYEKTPFSLLQLCALQLVQQQKPNAAQAKLPQELCTYLQYLQELFKDQLSTGQQKFALPFYADASILPLPTLSVQPFV